MLDEIIEKVKEAEADAEQAIAASYDKAYDIVQSAKTAAEQMLEKAHADAKAILKNKMELAQEVAKKQTNEILQKGKEVSLQIYNKAKESLNGASEFIVSSIIS